MQRTHTVFVVGAGASASYGFPVGWNLVQRLVRSAHKGVESPTFRTLLDCGHQHADVVAFAEALRRSGRTSIDAFLEGRPDFDALGRRAIAAALIPFETVANLFSVERDDDWLRYLCQFIVGGRATFEGREVSIVTFNYDRTIEHFFASALQGGFGLTEAEAADRMRHLEVIHVYGQLGDLPWQSGEYQRAFEPSATAQAVVAAADQIRIIHQADETRDEGLHRARAVLSVAKRVVFLGFGYHPTNLRRLGLNMTMDGAPELLGSAYGLLDGERQTVLDLLNRRIKLYDGQCRCRATLQSIALGNWWRP
jgi:hypothetical protein